MHYRFWDFIAHASIVLASMFIVFFCIDRVNPAMDFLGSTLSKWTLLVISLCALFNGACSAAFLFKRKRRGYEHGRAAHARQINRTQDSD